MVFTRYRMTIYKIVLHFSHAPVRPLASSSLDRTRPVSTIKKWWENVIKRKVKWNTGWMHYRRHFWAINSFSIQIGTLTLTRGVQLILGRIRCDANYGFFVHTECHSDGKYRYFMHVIRCAINWINDPCWIIRQCYFCGRFFAENSGNFIFSINLSKISFSITYLWVGYCFRMPAIINFSTALS